LKLANRAKGLSEQILTFGRPSGEAMKVYADIAPVLDEAMSMVRALIPASIDILIDIRRPLGPVDCDPNELQQLVVNLCSNAYKAIAKGDGRIMVGGEEVEVTPEFVEEQPRLKAGRYVLLTVTDNGEGMESATIERMFDPFFSTRDVGKGTGLGLSVVHGIVAKHGGEILVSSEVGVGTKIGVYLPQAEACQSRT
jgi:signal transduction histidine kinase